MRRLLLISEQEDIEIPDVIVDANKIYYTSTDSNTVTPYSSTAFNATINSNAFDSSMNMFAITYSGDLTQVGSNAFRNRPTLQTMYLPDSVTSIADRAFYYCTSLTYLDCGEGLQTIGASAFSTCSALATLKLGSSITSIGQYGFYGCSALEELYCMAITPPTGAYGMFDELSETCKIYVPAASLDAYKTASRWSDIADQIIGI